MFCRFLFASLKKRRHSANWLIVIEGVASLVQLVKSQKVLAYQQLVAECIQQLQQRFKIKSLHFVNILRLFLWGMFS